MKPRELSTPKLGVNIDHVATVRQARGTVEPDPVWAAALAELGGADCITIHLREDRRHIQDRDFLILKDTTKIRLNLEMACDEEIVSLACANPPDQVTLVPEKREELTTEGGLELRDNDVVVNVIKRLRSAGISVSLFLDPNTEQINRAAEFEVDAVELHTGAYADASAENQKKELLDLVKAAELVRNAGMMLNAGHGLTYTNVLPVASIYGMHELNIGHSIVARSVFVGIERAVQEMKQILNSMAPSSI